MIGRIASLHRSGGGVPKLSVTEVAVTPEGMAGDKQRDRRFHGGPERALSLYSAELIDALHAEGHPIVPGAIGENVTIHGLDWREVQPGARLQLGELEIEVTAFAAPCTTIQDAFLGQEFTRVSHKLHPGWSRVYARVLNAGVLRVGDDARIVDPAVLHPSLSSIRT